MRLVAVVLTLAFLSTAAFAASGAVQQGECRYTGDWRTQATPVTTGGPGLHQYADVGACASVSAVKNGGRVDTILRADIVSAEPHDVLVKYGQGSSKGAFPCGRTVWCEVGPLSGWFSGTGCAFVEVWIDGVRQRAVTSCA